MNNILSTEGLITSGIVDLVWGRGWRKATSEALRNAEHDAPQNDEEVVLPKRAVISVFMRELPHALKRIERSGNDNGKYVFIIRDGDSALNHMLEQKDLPSYIHHAFSVYAPAHPRVTPMPFALRYLEHVDKLVHIKKTIPRTSTNRVLVAHAVLRWFRSGHERATANRYFSDKTWATTRTAPLDQYPLPYDEYLSALRAHDYFVVGSGDGAADGGIERIAQWEAMALGTIPICTKRQARWSDMPIAIVSDWNDVTEDWCINNLVTRERSAEKMTLSYWVTKISEKAKDL